MKEKQITFPFVYREFIIEIGQPKPIAYSYDYTVYYTSIHKLGDEKCMIYCGKIMETTAHV